MMNDLFDTLPQPLFILDTHGKVLDLNPAARALAWDDGLPADELSTLLGALTRLPHVVARLRTAFDALCAASCDMPAQRIFVPAVSTPCLGLSEDMNVILWSMASERIGLALIEIHATSQEQNAARLAGLGSWRWFPQTNTVNWSPTLYEIIGLEPERVPATFDNFMARIHPEDRQPVSDFLQGVLNNERALEDLHYRIVRPDGETRFVRVDSDTIITREGVIEEMFGSVLDITASVIAEQSLRIQNEQLELAMASSNLHFWDWNLLTGKVSVDPRLAERLGLAQGEDAMDFDRRQQWVHADDLSAVETSIARYLAGELSAFDIKLRIKQFSGDWVWFHCLGKVVERNAVGDALRFIGTLRDISRERWLEAEIETIIGRFGDIAAQLRAPPVSSQSTSADAPPLLSERQKQVLKLIHAGKTSNDIAEILHIGTATVISHRRALLRKLNAHSSVELIVWIPSNSQVTPCMRLSPE